MRFITFSLVVCLAATLAVAATTTTTTTTTTTSAADDGPRHVHFAYGADTSSSLKVSWQLTKYDPTINQALVKYGVSSGSYPFVLDGYNVTFSTYNATAAGYFLQVTLTKLTPATTYYIVVGDTATMKYSKEFAIKTLPSILDPNTGGVSIAIYGDLGIKNSDHVVPRLIQLSDANAVDFFMHVGDISYADDYENDQYEGIWEQFMTNMDEIYARKPYMVCPGNHEADGGWDTIKYPFAPYNARFNMPWRESNSTTNMWYSFNVMNLVHFVALDTETDFPGAPEFSELFGQQLTWLEADLAAAKAAGYRFIIALGHRPIYSSANGYSSNGVPSGECALLQAAIEPLFQKYGVDLFFVGHQHAYEATYPVFNNTKVSNSYTNASATVHVISGSAGCEEGISANWVAQPDWLAVRYPEKSTVLDPGYGYGILHIKNAATLHWEFFNSQSTLEHEFYLVKE